MGILKNIKLTISYDGTDYSGWQRQKNKRTIQGILEEALRKVTDEKELKLHGSGRTDAGVHAIGQIANFKTTSGIPVDKLAIILNNILPSDIRIKFAKEVSNEFHSRYDARGRIYRYYINNKISKSKTFRAKDLFLSRYCFFYNYPLEIKKMVETAQYLLGTHDFSALSCYNQKSGNKLPDNRIRNIKKISITKRGALIIFSIEADAFLYKMVRKIIGTLLDFSIKQYEPESILEILRNKDNQKSGKVIPPNGLYLMKVKYQ